MALVDIDGYLYWPPRPGAADNVPSLSTHILDGSGDMVGAIFQAPKAGTLAKVGFRTSTVSNAEDLKVAFEGVTASGKPDTTIAQFRVVGSIVANSWFETGLITNNGTDGGTKRTVAKGDFLAVTIGFDSWVAGNVRIRTKSSDSTVVKYPMGLTSINGGSTWVNISRVLDLYLEYDDGSAEPINGIAPFLNITAQSYDVNNSPDEYALRFSVPFPCRVCGIWLWADGGISGGTEIILYEGTSVKKMVNHFSEVTGAAGMHTVLFNAPVVLATGTVYYAAYRPLTTANCTIALTTFNDAKHRNAYPGKSALYLATRTDQGAWSDVTTQRPFIGLVLDQLGDGVSGGGGGESSHVF